jgi:hypothetical protein
MIPGILAPCPTLERYRTLSQGTLEALGLPRRQFRVKSVVLGVYQRLPFCFRFFTLIQCADRPARYPRTMFVIMVIGRALLATGRDGARSSRSANPARFSAFGSPSV